MFGALFGLAKSFIPAVFKKIQTTSALPALDKLETKMATLSAKTKEYDYSSTGVVTEQDKRWYHLSFFYRGTDFQPIYFYIFWVYALCIAFCGIKLKYYWDNPTIDVSETLILQLFGLFVSIIVTFNAFNKKDPGGE